MCDTASWYCGGMRKEDTGKKGASELSPSPSSGMRMMPVRRVLTMGEELSEMAWAEVDALGLPLLVTPTASLPLISEEHTRRDTMGARKKGEGWSDVKD